MTVCATIFNRYYRAPKLVVEESGPTVIADLNWLTDSGILNMVGAPIENGFYVGTWPFATGGTATSALAIAAGADGGPVYDLTNGVGSDGTGNLALTLPSPVTIPANADCVIYLKGVIAGGDIILGHSTSLCQASFGISAGAFMTGAAGAVAGLYGEPVDGTYLFRARRVSNAWRFAWTGQADTADDSGGTLAGGALSFDTLLASGDGALLATFAFTGNYIQKIKIWSGTSDPDTAYETANGGTL